VAGKTGGGASAESLDREGFARVAGVSRETAERFEIWRALLVDWNARINLVGGSTLADFWRRHALDSAQIVDLVPDTESPRTSPRRWVDLGSGAGFPGLAVALALEGAGRTDEVHLVESNQKKAAFLREAVRATGSRAVVRAMRVEALAALSAPERFDVVVARACAPLTRLLGYASSLWKDDSVGVFLKGREAEAELTLAAKSWRFQFDLQPSRSDPFGRVVLIERLEHVQRT
jgi:16S rRNA (guanine527-N7)-methyltransferase